MGKKCIIEFEDKPFHKGNGDFLYRVKGFNSLVFDMTGINKLTPYTEPDLEQVRKEAYGEGFRDGQYAERNGLTASYAQKQETIQVGDEVIPRETEYDTMIVTRLWKDDYDSACIDAIGFDGRISSFLVSRVSKTGKHYEIAEALAKMREGSNQNHIQETMSDDY